MIFFIVFFTTVLINHCCSNCCCKCCKYSAIEENNNEKNQKGYFIPSRYFNKSTLDERYEIKDPNERTITSSELFVDSEIPYKTLLNIEWANNNCAVLSVVRLLISEKNFLDRLLNKKLVDPSKFKFMNANSTKERLALSNIPEILDKTSNLCKSILNGEKAAYGDFLDWLGNQHQSDPNYYLSEFVCIYLRNDFDCVIDDIKKRMKSKKLSYMWPSSCYKGDECITGKYIIFECELKDVKVILDDDIEIVQSSGETKYYELIGSIWSCGNVLNPTTSSADHVCIVPVFDKNKNKLGYVKYQFDTVSDVKPLTYWNNVDNFGKWENPRPYLAIYRLEDEALND